jgi:hypothetical protein
MPEKGWLVGSHSNSGGKCSELGLGRNMSWFPHGNILDLRGRSRQKERYDESEMTVKKREMEKCT